MANLWCGQLFGRGEAPPPSEFVFAQTPAYPLLHWEPARGAGDAHSVDVEDLGTAFFINPLGLFLTARHVVENASAETKPYSVFRIEGSRFDRLPILRPHGIHYALQKHPVVDVAIGFVKTTRPLNVHRLGTKRLPEGARVVTYGFSRTEVVTDVDPVTGLRRHGMNFRPRSYDGVVEDYVPSWPGSKGHGSPVYVTNVRTEGGISGGPVVNVEDGAVYGINCASIGGEPPCSWAVEVAAILDWPIDFVGGATLRELSQLEPPVVHLAP